MVYLRLQDVPAFLVILPRGLCLVDLFLEVGRLALSRTRHARVTSFVILVAEYFSGTAHPYYTNGVLII